MDDDMIKEIFLKYPEGVMKTFVVIIKKIGFETLCLLSEEFGGTTLYIPTKKRLFSGCFERQIKSEFDGTNIKELAKKYGFSERTVRSFVEKKIDNNKKL